MNKTDLFQLIESEIQSGNLNNGSLIELINLISVYLNPVKLKDYAKANGISYNGAKHHRNPVEILGVKYIVDNY